ncbi:MAG: asparagine synthase C-terminal domain-containing protein, partial [Bacteroidota bacterium]|nr:asparagine synthase C-terminal domain-containing protein [Bacteroidota bacterium]
APYSIFKNVRKVGAGTYLEIKGKEIKENRYYSIPESSVNESLSYDEAQKTLIQLLDKSVERRLISDVPLGAFLSGGIDSSVIVALASKHTEHLNTFSIGYKDEPFFDETKYAELVADKYKTKHTTFSLSNDTLFENLFDILNYIDEPFGDSSAIAVNILSKYTRKHVTVALSGDGADELFAGYNKHAAELKLRNPDFTLNLLKFASPLLSFLPKSRNSKFANKIRQIDKFKSGMELTPRERYWEWCSFVSESSVNEMLNEKPDYDEYNRRKDDVLKYIRKGSGINDVLYSDMLNVLQNDMLVKVDMMSMANSLEVRTPFLDYEVVNFAFSLPSDYKINSNMRKRILQDAFRNMLPEELYNRPKHGFEVPLLKWMKNELRSMIESDLLEDNYIKEQNIFNPVVINELKTRLFSTNPGDITAQIWTLIVFQYWWKKLMVNG